STRTRARAAPRSRHTAGLRAGAPGVRAGAGRRAGPGPVGSGDVEEEVHGDARAGPRRRSRRRRPLHVLEELGVRIDDQYVVLVLAALGIGHEAAVERIELGRATVSRGVDLGGAGVALAADALGLAVRFRQQHLAL